jgi:hypothetical protein
VTRATDRFSSGSESRKARRQWLTPVILATREAEIRRITVRSQPGQIVCEILSRKTLHKNRVGGAAHGEGPEFKPQYRKNKKRIQKNSQPAGHPRHTLMSQHHSGHLSFSVSK